MADVMQGIMALSQAPDSAETPQMDPMAGIDPAALAAFEEARATADPVQVGSDLLREGEKADPATVSALRSTLKSANLPPQILDAIGQMVDAIMAEPEKYQELRAGFLAEGVPEDLLPAQFDPEFFGALNLVLDQMNTGYPQEPAPETGGIAAMPMGAMEPGAPQAFAQGGIAGLKPLAAEMAKMGRRGDTMLAHITPAEARMLRRRGGSGTRNPSTGLPEFFVDKLFKSVGNAFKSVGKAVVKGVKAVASGVKKFASSTVGKVVIAAALGFFLGPAAATFLGISSSAGVAAVSGFVGGFGSSMLAGKSVGESLKMGAIGGVGAGLTAGALGGLDAFSAGSYAGPTTVGGQWDSLVSGAKNLVGAGAPPTGVEVLPVAPPTSGTITSPDFTPDFNQYPTTTGISASPDTSGFTYTADAAPSAAPSAAPTPAPANIDSQYMVQDMQGGPGVPSFMERATQGTKDLFNKGLDFLTPSTPSDTALAEIGDKAVKALGPNVSEQAKKYAFDQAVKKATPNILQKYGPIAAAGVGIMGLTGGFKTPESEKPGIIPQQTGYDFYKQNPERYDIKVPDALTTYAPDPYQNMYKTPLVRAPMAPRRYAEGGDAQQADYPRDMNDYPPMDGPINGPGTGTSDSIPAMLSDGEFVMTARAVKGAGNGSRRAGAKRMYALMKQLEEAYNGN